MTTEEILELFEWTIEEYCMIKNEYKEAKYGYFTAIIDIFSQITNYEKGEQNEQKKLV